MYKLIVTLSIVSFFYLSSSAQSDSADLILLVEGRAKLYYNNTDLSYYVAKEDVSPTKVNKTYPSRFFEYFMRDCKRMPKWVFRNIKYERKSLEDICRRYNQCEISEEDKPERLDFDQYKAIRFGVKAGVNVSQIYFTDQSVYYTSEKLNTTLSYLFGVELNGTVKGFTFGLDLLYIHQSGESTVEDTDYDDYTYLSYGMLQLGLNPGYIFDINEQNTLSIHTCFGLARGLNKEYQFKRIYPDRTEDRFSAQAAEFLNPTKNKLFFGGEIRYTLPLDNHLLCIALRYQKEHFDIANNLKLLETKSNTLVSTVSFFF